MPIEHPNVRSDELSAKNSEAFRTLSIVLLCAACALLTWSAVWIAVPRSNRDWRFEFVLFGLLFASGPLIAAGRSIRALAIGSSASSRLARFLLRLAIVVLVFVFLLAVSLARAVAPEELNSTSLIPSLLALVLMYALGIVGMIRLFIPAAHPSWERERVLHWLVVVSVCGPIAGLLLWSVLNIALVEWRASLIAGSAPYCLQVPTGLVGYKPVAQWTELAGLRMQAPFEPVGGATAEEIQWAFHAILVVKQKDSSAYYNWSYLGQDFVRLPEETRSRTHVSAKCEPTPWFLYKLDGL